MISEMATSHWESVNLPVSVRGVYKSAS